MWKDNYPLLHNTGMNIIQYMHVCNVNTEEHNVMILRPMQWLKANRRKWSTVLHTLILTHAHTVGLWRARQPTPCALCTARNPTPWDCVEPTSWVCVEPTPWDCVKRTHLIIAHVNKDKWNMNAGILAPFT